MSRKHPVIAVTGSSGAGTTTVKRAFENLFRREKRTSSNHTPPPIERRGVSHSDDGIRAAIIEGDSLHSLDRAAFRAAAAAAAKAGNNTFSHFRLRTIMVWDAMSGASVNVLLRGFI